MIWLCIQVPLYEKRLADHLLSQEQLPWLIHVFVAEVDYSQFIITQQISFTLVHHIEFDNAKHPSQPKDGIRPPIMVYCDRQGYLWHRPSLK